MASLVIPLLLLRTIIGPCRPFVSGRRLQEDAQHTAAAALAQNQTVLDSVVKIFCDHSMPNYSLPWQRQRQTSTFCTGFLATGDRGERWIVTNAHCVEYSSQVRVQRRSDNKKFIARVLSIGQESDTALLTVDDPEFWRDSAFVTFGDIPSLQDQVTVVGFPTGGSTVSLTSGIVSRIEMTTYSLASANLLGIQIDAAINPGNSGGPVFSSKGACVGIAFQKATESGVDNIGYVIPVPVLFHFLDDYKANGTYLGFPAIGVDYQVMKARALRAAYNVTVEEQGLLISKVLKISPSYGLLQDKDVLLEFDGVPVAPDGTVPFHTGERIASSYLSSQKHTGDTVRVKVLRQGQPLDLTIRLMRQNPLVPYHLSDQDPSYLLVAGLLFNALSVPYLASEYGSEWGRIAPSPLLDVLETGRKEFPDEQVVVLGQIMATAATFGYSSDDFRNVQVHKFSGTPVRNLQHLSEMVVGALLSKEPYMRFEVGHDGELVLETATVADATAQALKLYSVPRAMSKDLLQALHLTDTAITTPAALPAAAATPAAVTTAAPVTTAVPVSNQTSPSLPLGGPAIVPAAGVGTPPGRLQTAPSP